MLNNEDGTLRGIAWTELFPWLSIFRSFRLAISARSLALSAVAIFLTFAGWAAIGCLFGGDGDNPAARLMTGCEQCPGDTLSRLVPDAPYVPDFSRADLGDLQQATPVGPWSTLSGPMREAFLGGNVTTRQVACFLLSGLWSLAIWAFFGAAITRMAAVQLAAGEQVGLGAALRFACSKWTSYFSAPLFPIIGILIATVPLCLLGLALRADVGLLLLGIIWPLFLLAGLLMTVLLLGLLFGWPLMWATISSEGTDSFDALSRSYAYVYQKPLQYLFYVIVAAMLGALGWLFVSNFAAGVVSMTYWATAWGCGNERITEIATHADSLSQIGYAGSAMILFWTGCVKLLAVGFLYSYFWTATTSIYFLLRRDTDATEMDEVFLDEDETEEVYDLPPIKQDESGAPVVNDAKPEDTPDEEEE